VTLANGSFQHDFGRVSFLRAPLCPAGHLPLEWGDQSPLCFRLTYDIVGTCSAHSRRLAPTATRLISPAEGEMAGRAEGGNVERLQGRTTRAANRRKESVVFHA